MKKNWEFGVLGDAVDKGSSNISLNKIQNDNGEFPVYGAKGFAKNISFYQQENKYLAIIKDGAGIGRISIHPEKSSVLATMQYIIPKQSYDIKFLYYFLNAVDFENYRMGSTIPHIYFKHYKSEPFPLINIEEQKQIVNKLDQVIAGIDKAKLNIEKNLKNAKELFQGKLNEIFSQKGEGWVEKKLGEITSKIGSGATPRGGQSSYKEFGISLIRSLNVYDDGFREKKLAFIDNSQAQKLNNVAIESGDVLLNITGGSVARCCIAPNDFLPARVNQHVSIIRLKGDAVSSEFLHYSLIAKINKDLLLRIGEQGATRQAITKAQIENFIVSYPEDNKEQKQSVELIIRLKNQTLSLESKYQQELNSLEELKKSILEKAFAGEL